jgi:hypothetical protein
MAKARDRPSTDLKRELQAETRAYCARRYEELRGHPWPASSVAHFDAWIDECNRDEKDAFAAFTALRSALVAVQAYYRKHPAGWDPALVVHDKRVEISDAAFFPDDAHGDYSPDEYGSSSQHGTVLHLLRGHLEPMIRLPWVSYDPRRTLWTSRLSVVARYDRDYPTGALRTRAKGATSPTRLSPTELTWHALLCGCWPGMQVVKGLKPQDVVAAETKQVVLALRRFAKLRQWAESLPKP